MRFACSGPGHMIQAVPTPTIGRPAAHRRVTEGFPRAASALPRAPGVHRPRGCAPPPAVPTSSHAPEAGLPEASHSRQQLHSARGTSARLVRAQTAAGVMRRCGPEHALPSTPSTSSWAADHGGCSAGGHCHCRCYTIPYVNVDMPTPGGNLVLRTLGTSACGRTSHVQCAQGTRAVCEAWCACSCLTAWPALPAYILWCRIPLPSDHVAEALIAWR